MINYVDGINLAHGATEDITDPYTQQIQEIERKGYGSGLKLLRAKVRHLGTEMNLEILKSIFEDLKQNGVDMRFETKVNDIIIEDSKVCGVVIRDTKIISENVVLAPGRNGAT